MGFWVSLLGLPFNKKWLFFVWFLVLWGVLSWLLYEAAFPRSSYSPFVLPGLLVFVFSVSLLIYIGKELYSFLSPKEFGKKDNLVFLSVFLVATLLFVIFTTPSVIMSFNNKAIVQWYIDDLKSQGFTVDYFAQYPYNRGRVEHPSSYEDFTSLAEELNCTWVGVYGGAPNYFLFFFPSSTCFLINQNGQYEFCITW
jgi:hypothetical protein